MHVQFSNLPLFHKRRYLKNIYFINEVKCNGVNSGSINIPNRHLNLKYLVTLEVGNLNSSNNY